MVRQLDDFDQLAVRAGAGERKAVRLELLAERVVELVAMAVSLADPLFAVGFAGVRALRQNRRLSAEAHRAPFVGNVPLVIEQANQRMGSVLVELGAMGAG